MGTDLRSKGQRCERKRRNHFSRICSSKVGRFTSHRDQNDQRPILHVIEYISYGH